MKKYIQLGKWFFEITGITARRVDNFGDEYDAIGTITIANGAVNIQGLLSRGESKIGKEDVKVLAKFIKMLGYSEYITCTYKNGESVKRTVKI